LKSFWKNLGTIAFWVGWPVVYLSMRGRQRVRLLITDQGKVLMVKNWLGANEWSLPGGGMRLGENPAAAAARELKEETGLNIEPAKLKSLGKKQTNVHGLKFFYHCFFAEAESGELPTKRNLDVVESSWFKVEDLAKQNLAPDARDILHQQFPVKI
jgi:ADP-ribose pyrophosphatase YjhB (NUDIX family)